MLNETPAEPNPEVPRQTGGKHKLTCLMVDYENVGDFCLGKLPAGWIVKVFVGKTQKNIPFALVTASQNLGDRLEWIQINGTGHNNLDFHIAFYIGQFTQRYPDADIVILSNDKGFDPLIAYVNHKAKRAFCRRVPASAPLVENRKLPPDLERLRKLLEGCRNALPAKRKSLESFVGAMLKNENLSQEAIKQLVDGLFRHGIVYEGIKRLTYHLPGIPQTPKANVGTGKAPNGAAPLQDASLPS